MRSTVALAEAHVPGLLAAFGLGSRGQLSDGPIAEGRVGSLWRLDSDLGSWVAKPLAAALDAREVEELLGGLAFQEACARAGVPTPAIRRTPAGEVVAEVGDVRVMVQSWVDLCAPDLALDAVALGGLVAALHRVNFAGAAGRDPWYEAPVGAARWRELATALRGRGAPFADEVAALVPELSGLETLLGTPPRALLTCHRDLWADNLRAVVGGGLCVFDFEDAGLADPSQELALVLVEFAGTDPARGRLIREAYADAGGPGVVLAPTDFAMPIAQLGHILETGCRRWLAATTDAGRADNEAWVREYLDRPLSRALIEALLDA